MPFTKQDCVKWEKNNVIKNKKNLIKQKMKNNLSFTV